MKVKILVKRINKNLDLPVIKNNGEFIDLRASETHRFKAPQAGVLKEINGEKVRDVKFDTYLMPLGVAIRVPKGFECVVIPRSSLPFGFGVMVANSIGLIDWSYNSNTDEWKAPLVAIRNTTINQNERICQFKVQLSQKATLWQKIKWLFTNGVEITEVEELPETNARGGFGTSGKV